MILSAPPFGMEADMDREALKRELTEQFQQSLDQAMEAVQRAPDGAWIAASEWEVRAVFQKLTAQAFERILQAKMDAAEVKPAAFSPDRDGKAGEQRKPRTGRADRRG
jgi:hypothetical protein